MERVILKYLYHYFHKHDLFYKYQASFLPGHSTVYQLLENYHSIVQSIDEGKYGCMIFFVICPFDVEYFLYENDIEEEDDVIVPYFLSTCMRRDRVPSVPTFYEEVLPDFSILDLYFHI